MRAREREVEGECVCLCLCVLTDGLVHPTSTNLNLLPSFTPTTTNHPTGTSAIWAAQRVPDGHISLVANQFVIRGVKKDHPDFLYSDNLWDAAQRNGLWSPDQGVGAGVGCFMFFWWRCGVACVWNVFVCHTADRLIIVKQQLSHPPPPPTNQLQQQH